MIINEIHFNQSTVFNVPKQSAEIEPWPAHKWLAYKQEIWLEIFKICGEHLLWRSQKLQWDKVQQQEVEQLQQLFLKD